MHPDRIILVYNEDSGVFNAVVGWSHKLLSPETYYCPLCRVTFGLAGMLVAWKNYLEKQPFPVTHLHRDEFRMQFPQLAGVPLPVILTEKTGETKVLLTSEEIGAVGGVLSHIARVDNRLEWWRVEHSRVSGVVKSESSS